MTNKFFVFSESVRRVQCQRQNSPFKNYIGQNGAIEKLMDVLYQALSNEDHLVEENIMFAGPPSTGKTTLAKNLAESLMTPVVYTDSNQINNGISVEGKSVPSGADTVIHLILDVFAKNEDYGPLEGKSSGSFTYYKVPPMMVFIDEIHGLKRKTADALLKATERNDGMLLGKNIVLDCKSVLWVAATTDWGDLPPAFQTRFSRFDLEAPTKEEVSQIVNIHNPDLDRATCDKIVYYGSLVPREALSFARSVKRYAARMGVAPIAAVWESAKREGVDYFGMRRQRLEILKVLHRCKDGVNLRNLASAISVEGNEMVRYWLPPMLFSKPSLVVFNKSKYQITESGIAELKLRGYA